MASQEAPVAEPDEVRLSEPAPPEAVAETASALSFIHRAELPGGVSIELGGIAWSEARPFALLNRQVVGPGESVDGYAVVAIAPGQVELEVDGRTVYIRLK